MGTAEEVEWLNKSEVDEYDDTRELTGIVLSALPLVLIISLSVVGNTAVIVAILWTPRLREKTSSLFLINLSLTDTLNALLVMPLALVSLLADRWVLGAFLCYAQCALNYWFIIVSMLTLAMISIDGYYAVIHPLHYTAIVTPRVTRFGVFYAWSQGCIFACIPVAFQWIVYDYWEVTCAIDWDSYSSSGALTYVVVACVICFLVPASVMSFCYTKICRIARQKAVAPAEAASVGAKVKGNRRQSLQERRVIQSLALVVAVFFLCMTPFCVTKLIKIVTGTQALPPYLYLASSLFAYLASATNPFIYAIFRRDFRQAFKKLFCRGSFLSRRFANDSSLDTRLGRSTTSQHERRRGGNRSVNLVSADAVSNAQDVANHAIKGNGHL